MVETNRSLAVIARIGAFQLGLDLLEFAQLVVGDVGRRACGELAADMSLHVGNVGEVTSGHRQHHKAAVRLLGNQTFGTQGEQRLTDGCDADAQFGGKLVQPNVLARGVGAVENPAADETRDVLGKLRARNEIRAGHRLRPDTRPAVAC